MATIKTKKNEKKYYCDTCYFITCKKTDYTRHLLTHKHIINHLATNGNIKNDIQYICEFCEKNYKDRTGLWKHKKVCNIQKETILDKHIEHEKIKIPDDNLITMLINQCKELRDENKELIEIIKNGTHNNNSHNKTFNLQFFLNDTCKDAMNIMEFVDSIKLQLSDLEKLGEIGYIEAISNIITSKLKLLDITQRPIHCTDKKREVLYIKDEDKWEKEIEEKKKVRKAIHMVANKNIQLLSKFKEIHPDCSESDSHYSDQYHQIIMESMGGSGENNVEKEDKIITNILKTVTIDKEE